MNERHCKICGCCDSQACPGGCHWVANDLCSSCDEKWKDFYKSDAYKQTFEYKYKMLGEATIKLKWAILEAFGILPEIIICSAVKSEDGKIYRGHRHGDAMRACQQTGRKLFNGREQQGFITSRNRYVLRKEARELQEKAGIKSADPDGYRHRTLFSEDLY